ncbi:MAG: PTS sugar transporter subunit IIA [Bradyrhizobium sp.]|nr:PTS sugar transporter subunit IIA [Bradyrhizobium sp.]
MVAHDLLDRRYAFVDVRAHEKRQVLSELAKQAAPALNIPPEIVRDALLQREELGSTGMGNGIAIPHARFDQMRTPFGLLARLKPAIPFEAIDDQPVDLVFLLLLPKAANGENLKALTCIARRLRDPAIATALRKVKSAVELYQQFVQG